MDLIFDGQLSDQLSTKELLERIAARDTPGRLYIRFSQSPDQIEGAVVVVDCRSVTAAGVFSTTESGYQALKKLLSLKQSYFAVLSAGKHEETGLEPSMSIDLDRLIKAHPHFPAHANELFDERALLDKVFDLAPSSTQEIRPRESQEIYIEGPPAASADERGWDLMQPLLDDESYPPGTIKLTGDDVKALAQESRAQRITTTRARAVEPLESQAATTLRFSKIHIALIFVLILLAVGAVLLILRSGH